MKKIRRAWYCPECKVISVYKGLDYWCDCMSHYFGNHDQAEIRRVQKSWVPLWEIRG